MNLLFTICILTGLLIYFILFFLAPMSWKLAIFSDQHLSIVCLSVKQRAMSFPRGDKHEIRNLTIFWTAVLPSTIIVTKHPYVTKIRFCLVEGSCFHVNLQVVLVTDWRSWAWRVHYWVLAFLGTLDKYITIMIYQFQSNRGWSLTLINDLNFNFLKT